MSLSTDASAFRWAAVFHQHPTDRSVGDYWEDSLMNEHINVKEMHAVLKALECLPASVRDCRLDIQVDNLATLHAWQGRGPRSLKLNEVARLIFHAVTKRNLALSMSYIRLDLNPANYFPAICLIQMPCYLRSAGTLCSLSSEGRRGIH